MEVRTLPANAAADAGQPNEEQPAFGDAADGGPVPPADDDGAWWLPDEADMTGPDSAWRNGGGQWTPPDE